ncbi:hypothetical protein DPMN_023076 [Dreissena polymorpha]|uniref:Uncharacterized protein n=1 Tax=Dreissena polymorpha TaxID=45954 RepID=A0A9D4LM05_DREPO|nr:hypothetical protein DPMN_023076 [Dreissena polymorpha]
MPNAIESFLRVHEVVEELTFVLRVFLDFDSAVDDLFHFAPLSCQSSLLFGKQFMCLTFQSIKDYA